MWRVNAAYQPTPQLPNSQQQRLPREDNELSVHLQPTTFPSPGSCTDACGSGAVAVGGRGASLRRMPPPPPPRSLTHLFGTPPPIVIFIKSI